MVESRLERVSRTMALRTDRRSAMKTAGATGIAAGILGLAGRIGSTAAAATAEVVDNALPLLVPFVATIRQGPDAGTEFLGFLKLTVEADGKTTGGFLTTDGDEIPLTGQVTGQSVGLLFTPAEDQHIYGVGVASEALVDLHGYSPVAIGGTLVGPAEGDTGDWAVLSPGNLIGGRRSSVCKSCLQSCRSGFGYGTVPPEEGVCRDICLQFGDAGFGGCSDGDFL